MVGAIESRGKTNLAAPRRMASRGMPKTTHVASFWAIVERTGFTHLEQAACSVISHSGHDHTGRIGAGRLRCRPKEDFDAGSVPAHGRACDQLDAMAGTGAADDAVNVAGDQERPPGADGFVLCRFSHFDFDARVFVEPLGKGGCKRRRHVLHDHDAGRGSGKYRQ